MKIHPFVEAVASMQFKDCFNPYSDQCEVHDRHDAPQCRAAALSATLHRATEEHIDAIWIGRDLGYRGGRRTGLALTDDVHMGRHARRWNLDPVAERPTIGSAVAERTAAVIWNMLELIDARIFLWNVFPLHPHKTGEPFTNRKHNAYERRAGEVLLQQLIALLRPSRIVAIGNDAAASALKIQDAPPVICVRHPSYGGQTMFQGQISELYGNPIRTKVLFDKLL